jgi:hypothetical protein
MEWIYIHGVLFKDKVPAVRAQAVMALQRLQDPNDPECPVIKGKKLNL